MPKKFTPRNVRDFFDNLWLNSAYLHLETLSLKTSEQKPADDTSSNAETENAPAVNSLSENTSIANPSPESANLGRGVFNTWKGKLEPKASIPAFVRALILSSTVEPQHEKIREFKCSVFKCEY